MYLHYMKKLFKKFKIWIEDKKYYWLVAFYPGRIVELTIDEDDPRKPHFRIMSEKESIQWCAGLGLDYSAGIRKDDGVRIALKDVKF